MCQRLIHASAASLLLAVTLSTAATTFGQPVSVGVGGGVHVRAPFVSVDVYPNGGVSVRAPYTAVDIGGRPYVVGRPVILEEVSIPSSQALAAMDDDALWRALRNASLRLNQRLSRFDTGATWQRYLRLPDELVSGSNADVEERRVAASRLQERFAEVATNQGYRKIADLPAFAAVQGILTEMASRQAGTRTVPAANAAGSAEELPPPARGPAAKEGSVLKPPQ